MFSQKQLSLWLLSGASCKVPLHLLQPWAGTIPSCMCWHTVDGIHAALVGRSECWASERTQVVGLHPLQLWKPKSHQNATHFVELLFFYLLRENYKLKSKRIDNYKHNNAQLFTVHLITRKLTFNHLKYQFPVVYSLFLSLPLLGPWFTPVDLEQLSKCASGKGLMHVGKDGQKLNPVSSYHIPELSISIQPLCELINHIWCSAKMNIGC